MELLTAFLGLAIGSIGTFYLVNVRIKDYQYFTERRISDYQDSFSKGFQTSNGHKPFLTEEKPVDIYSMDESNEYDYQTYKRERWDD